MNWLSVLSGAVGGFMGSQGYLWVKARLARPYRWKCQHCDFKMSMNFRSDILEEMKVDHLRTFHPLTNE